MTQTITGAALKAILKQSAAFDKADADPYTDNLHPGQGLLVLGALQNPETKSWYVNGQDVSDGRLYAVALTDFLAFGDTGYPDLATPPVPPAFRLNNAGDNGRATRITDLVAARVLGSKSTPPSLDISTYADHLKHNPFTQGPPATFFDKVGIMRRNAKKPEWKKDTAGALAEERAYWRLFVDKGELAFNRYENNYPFLGKLKSAFNGIPESGVTTPQSRSWSNALALELRREKRNRTWFARFEEEYARAFTQQSSPAGSYLLSYTSNRLGGEAGIRQTFSGTVRQGRWIGWVASFNATSQVVRPLDSESIALAKDGCPSLDPKVVCSVSFQTNLARTSRMLGKVGLRAETRTSWFEFGYFGGEVNRATRYHLINGSQDVSDCPPWDFSQCIGKPNTVPDGTSGSALRFQASSAAKPETGLFFNFNAALPIPKGYVVDAFTFDNRGMWFSNHDKDMQIDSRVSEKITFGAKIAIPALPNLSLMPSVAIFWYANKMKDELLFARTFDIKLDYRFDKATGTRWSRVLGFGRPK